MSQGWTTVFTGPPAEAEVMRSKLEAKGIPVFIPGDNLRTISPLGFGELMPFDRAVQVPPSALDHAQAILERSEDDQPIQPGEQELPQEFFADDSGADTPLMKEIAGHRRRILFGFAFPFWAPVAVWQLRPYLRAVRELGHAPPYHKVTIAAAGASLLFFAAIVYLYFL